jgi:hypothetical protein
MTAHVVSEGQPERLVNNFRDNRQFALTTCIGGQANSALNVQGGASPFPVPDSPQFPVRCPLGSLHFRARSVWANPCDLSSASRSRAGSTARSSTRGASLARRRDTH